jgi:SAM-dependent methyltransferase
MTPTGRNGGSQRPAVAGASKATRTSHRRAASVTMNAMDDRQRQAASFGAAAEAYERGRPEYPPEALDWLVPTDARHVLDLGAGTGKLTRQLVARGLDVIAVDPSEGMLEQLRAAVPGVPTMIGTAEEIPLEDGTVDAVLVAQAWHWVDPERAPREVARVLTPGGRLGLVWNRRDDRTAWIAAFGEIMKGGFSHDFHTAVVGPPFGPLERLDTEWSYELTTEQLEDLATSRSYVIGMSQTEREAILERVRALAERELERTGAERLSMPYVTQSFRARVQEA